MGGRAEIAGKKLFKIRAEQEESLLVSGGRVSNTWVICLEVGNNYSKG